VSASQRRKGQRIEPEVVELHRGLELRAERVPLSGASRYQGNGADVDVYPFGPDDAPLCCEVKARRDGDGFKTLERWLGENDALFLRRNHAEPLVLVRWARRAAAVWRQAAEVLLASALAGLRPGGVAIRSPSGRGRHVDSGGVGGCARAARAIGAAIGASCAAREGLMAKASVATRRWAGWALAASPLPPHPRSLNARPSSAHVVLACDMSHEDALKGVER
jgi:hypothetical protein